MRFLLLLAGGFALLLPGCARTITSGPFSAAPLDVDFTTQTAPARPRPESPVATDGRSERLLSFELESPEHAGDPFSVCWHAGEIRPEARRELTTTAVDLNRLVPPRPAARADCSDPPEMALQFSAVETIELPAPGGAAMAGNEAVTRLVFPKRTPAAAETRPAVSPSASAFTPYHWSSYTQLRNRSAANTAWHFRWERLFFGDPQTPLQTMHIGTGDSRTLVIGSLHGDEAIAPAVVEQLARSVGNHYDHWPLVSVLFIRSGNPHGLERHAAGNARGVDLNRNFPAPDFRADPAQGTGSAAASEAETRALMSLLSNYRPARVIHVKATPRPGVWVLCNLKSRELAANLSRDPNLQVGPLDERSLPGSIEGYCSTSLETETITIGIPRDWTADKAWEQIRPMLWTCLLSPPSASTPVAAALQPEPALPWRTGRALP